jgi:hypothetical protein
MTPNKGPQELLRQAEKSEEKYEWLDAANSYVEALKSKSSSYPLMAESWEKVGFCYELASRQAQSLGEFSRIRQLAIEAYQQASILFAKDESLEKVGKSLHCKAIAAYLGSWLANDASERKAILVECCKLGKNGLEAYEAAGNELSAGRICSDLTSWLLERLYVASDSREVESVAREGIDYGNKAVNALSRLDDKKELLRAYTAASLQGWYSANAIEREEIQKELAKKSLMFSEEALKLCKEVTDSYCKASGLWAASFCTLLFTEKVEASHKFAEEMLEQATITNDNYLMGVASYVLAFVTNWLTLREGDPDKRKKGYEQIIQYSEDAIRHLDVVSQDFFIANTSLFYAESYSSQVADFESSLEEKRAKLKKAVEVGREGLKHAIRAGSPDAHGSTLHALSKALHYCANLEASTEEKKRLLEEALVDREEYNRIVERAFPSNGFIRSVGENYEGLIRADLARFETDRDKKKALFERSINRLDDGIARGRRWVLSNPVPTRVAALGAFEDRFGGILNEFYLLTEDRKCLSRAIEVYENASEQFRKIGLPSRAAESYWKMALNQDLLGDYLKAAENFEHAVAQYAVAAEKIPHFADFYLDYGTYMSAWNEIARARYAHERENYDVAMKHYEKVAMLLKTSKLWNYLSSNFQAWSVLERAEDSSRRGKIVESTDAFREAADLFRDAKDLIEKEISKIQNVDEKEKAVDLVKASARRKDYCMARICLEEARVCDQEGHSAESAEKYETAASFFEKIIEALGSEVESREIRPFALMCRAWQKMKMADVRDSPELYHEASDLFIKVKEYSAKDKTTLLAAGNSNFCRALEYGTRFEATREKEEFTKAKQYLGSAANYYLKAGFAEASTWTNATEILLDAYNYMLMAEIENEPEKKMKNYLLAERCFERSAKLYETAGYVGKRDEICRTLEKVREKRDFVLSLEELLVAPGEASSTRAVSAPTLSVEEPVGLSKFEREFVQANLIVAKTETVVGENWSLEVQFANLGKNAAFLQNVENIVPEGFDLVEKPEKCLVHDGSISMRGRKLAPLESDEMKLTLKPKKKGKFILAPKIQFIDENGKSKIFELEQIAVTVKELGIRGWLKGSG